MAEVAARLFGPGASGVEVVAMGGQAALGLTLPALSAAWRGRLRGFAAVEHFRGYRTPEPYVLASLATLGPELPAFERMASLGAASLRETLALLGGADPGLGRLPVLLAVPAPRPGWDLDQGRRLARELFQALPVPVATQHCAVVNSGSDGGLSVLGAALDLMAGGQAAWCLVGGVESTFDLACLRWLEEQGRLRRGDRTDGFIPGEGAGFLLLVDRRRARERRWRPLAQVLGVSLAQEPVPWYTFRPSLGQGLTAAFHALLTGHRADAAWADLNGEPWRADEWALAYLRTARAHGEPLVLHHPADAWGDVGAASGPLLAGLAISEFLRGRSRARTALIWTASATHPNRSACLLQKPSPEDAP